MRRTWQDCCTDCLNALLSFKTIGSRAWSKLSLQVSDNRLGQCRNDLDAQGKLVLVILCNGIRWPTNRADFTDGDTLEQKAHHLMLWSIDASEAKKFAPTVGPDSPQQPAAGINCRPIRLSRSARGALAFTRYSADYLADRQRARSERRGLHAHNCAASSDYRAAGPLFCHNPGRAS